MNKIKLAIVWTKKQNKRQKRGAAAATVTISFCRHIIEKIKYRETQ